MPHRLDVFFQLCVNAIQWVWIGLVGLFASTGFEYKDDMHRVLITITSMALGTLASYYIKKYLNNGKKIDIKKYWNNLPQPFRYFLVFVLGCFVTAIGFNL